MSGRVDRQGGDFKQGVIRGVVLATRGEASGHGLWLDRPFLERVVALVRGTPGGIKSRFQHPELFTDGLGSMLGYIRGARVDGDRALADLHFIGAARKSPHGDIAEYTMDLAEDAPEDFGMSIAFVADEQAEAAFEKSHSAGGRFRSPDAQNTKHLSHARVARLDAVDAVDEPAANPAGLFSRRGGETLRTMSVPQPMTATVTHSTPRPAPTPKPKATVAEIERGRAFGLRMIFSELTEEDSRALAASNHSAETLHRLLADGTLGELPEIADRCRWGRDATLRGKFAGDLKSYLAYRRAERAGRVRVIERQAVRK